MIAGKNIWAVCSYFNYNGSSYRKKNYDLFRKRLKIFGINLMAVEFSPEKKFELNKNDADIVLRYSDGDVMWQKERLINLGIDRLPLNTDIVLILDTDVVFGSRLVINFIAQELNKNLAVQCFSSVSHVNPFTCDPETVDFFNIKRDDENIVFDQPLLGCICSYELTANFSYGCSGYAWAFRYETIKNIKLFEYNIIGGGDRISACAFIGIPIMPPTVAGQNEDLYHEYLNKVKSIGINRDTVTYVDRPIFDLFHGFHIDRQYEERHKILVEANFDAKKDLIISPGQPFKFADTVSEDTKNKIKDYFYSRSEL